MKASTRKKPAVPSNVVPIEPKSPAQKWMNDRMDLARRTRSDLEALCKEAQGSEEKMSAAALLLNAASGTEPGAPAFGMIRSAVAQLDVLQNTAVEDLESDTFAKVVFDIRTTLSTALELYERGRDVHRAAEAGAS